MTDNIYNYLRASNSPEKYIGYKYDWHFNFLHFFDI